MASYLPPTETLPIFDNTVFDSNNTTLTYTTAKKYFVTYPSAQGTSTITDFIAGTISYLSPASGSFFNIGTNQVSGGTVRIGPTGVSGVSVHAGNIDCTNNQINNATDSALNNLSLGNLQTSGVLNIGTGSRVLSGNGGAINIGTGSGAIVNPINIGGSGSSTNVGGTLTTTGLITGNGGIKTASVDTLTSGGNLDIGNSQLGAAMSIGQNKTSGYIALGNNNNTNHSVIINPPALFHQGSTFEQGITLSSGKYITTSHSGTVTAPTSSQVGGVVTGSDIASPTFPSSGNITSWASISLPAGTWVITGTRRYDSSASSTRILWSLGTTLRNNAASPDTTDNTYGVTSVVLNSLNNFVTITGTASLTVDTTVYFNIYAQYTVAPSISTVNSSLRAIRIA